MDTATAKAIVDQLSKVGEAAILVGKSSPGFDMYVLTIPLDTAQDEHAPFPIPFAFRACYIQDGTDPNCYLNLKPFSQDSIQGSSKLRKKDVWRSGTLPCPQAFLWWPAQAGKSLVLEFHLNSDVSPSQLGSSTTTLLEGTALSTLAKVSVANTATVVLAVDLNRKTGTVQNQSGSNMYFGSSAVTGLAGANPGIFVPPGGTYKHSNTDALYAIMDTGTGQAAVQSEA